MKRPLQRQIDVLEVINKTRDEYNAKIDFLAQKNDSINARNQELVDRVHALELKETNNLKPEKK